MPEKTLLPCFKPADWDGAERCVCRRFTVGDVESSHLPWLALGYDLPHSFEFLNHDALPGLKRTAEQAEREAIRSVRLRKATWNETTVKLGVFKKLRIAVCMDDFFSAEKILDVGFMREAARRLKTEGLAVGIPRRGLLMATKGQQDLEFLGAFAAAVSGQFHRADSPPITPAVFAVLNGEVVGMLQGGEGLGRAAADDEEEEQDFYVGGLVLADQNTGLESVHICAGGAKIETLGAAIQGAFMQTVQKHVSRKEFGGEIRVIIFNDMTPEAVRQHLPSLEAHLQGTLEEMAVRTKAGRPVTVEFEYKEGGP